VEGQKDASTPADITAGGGLAQGQVVAGASQQAGAQGTSATAQLSTDANAAMAADAARC
jgi:hypothetical protein